VHVVADFADKRSFAAKARYRGEHVCHRAARITLKEPHAGIGGVAPGSVDQ